MPETDVHSTDTDKSYISLNTDIGFGDNNNPSGDSNYNTYNNSNTTERKNSTSTSVGSSNNNAGVISRSNTISNIMESKFKYRNKITDGISINNPDKKSSKLRKEKQSLSLKKTLSSLSMSGLRMSSSGNKHNTDHQRLNEADNESSNDNYTYSDNADVASRKYSFAESLFKKLTSAGNTNSNVNPVARSRHNSDAQSTKIQIENMPTSLFRKVTNVVRTPNEQPIDDIGIGPLMKSKTSTEALSKDKNQYSKSKSDVKRIGNVNDNNASLNASSKRTSSRRNSVTSASLSRFPGLFKIDTSLENLSDFTATQPNQQNTEHIIVSSNSANEFEKDRTLPTLNRQHSETKFWSDIHSASRNQTLQADINTANSDLSPTELAVSNKNSFSNPDTISSQLTQQWIAPENWDVDASVDKLKLKRLSSNRSSTDMTPNSRNGRRSHSASGPSVSKLSSVNSKNISHLQHRLQMTPSHNEPVVPQQQSNNSSALRTRNNSAIDSENAHSDESDDINLNETSDSTESSDNSEYSESDTDSNIGLQFGFPSSFIPASSKLGSSTTVQAPLPAASTGNVTSPTESKTSMQDFSTNNALAQPTQYSIEDEIRDKAEYELEAYYKDVSDLDPNKHYAIRIFNTDNTFTTLSCTPDTTVQEIIPTLRKKFNISSQGNFQVSLKVGKLSKILKPLSKPIVIERKLLLLIGYKKTDPLHIMGIEDFSFVFKFHFHPVAPSHLTSEQEQRLMRSDFVHVDLRRMDLTTPPIIFYQHTAEIESLDVSNNANIFLPSEFIESAFNLSSLRMVNIRASRFPANITDAYKLVSLELQRNFIRKVPNSISKLTNLTILNLQCNGLEKLPKGFSNLKCLQLLDISSNTFVSYPEVINGCINLLQVDLSYNKIGLLPESTNKLVKLAKMNLSHNKLTSIGDLSGMKNLRTLNLRHNRITVIKTNAASLQNLFITDNRISTFDDTLPKLRALEIQENPITSIPYQDFYPWNMTSLSLSKAKLASIPGELFLKLSKLEKLDLSENNLTQIPKEISMLTKLIYLSLARNKLEGLPSEFSLLKNLKTLDLHSNNIRDFVAGTGNMELTYLNLSSNAFGNFSINGEFYQNLSVDSKLAKSLMFFIVADNQFNNSTWPLFNCLHNLKVLNISYNNFTDISNLKLENLSELYASGNKLTSLSSDTVLKWMSLKTLMLNGNQLLTLPAELSKLSQLTVFDVGSNQLKYNISNYHYDWNWRDNKELRYLNFSGNRRFEIKSFMSHDIQADLSDLTVLPQLRVLGLMDVTLNTSKVPDESFNFRLRTSGSTINGMSYGVADTLGHRDYVSSRDVTFERFRGKDDECLLCLHDSKNQSSDYGHNISRIVRDIYDKILRRQLEKYSSDDEGVKNALRFSFLQLNKEINMMLNAVDNGEKVLNLTSADLLSGACSTVIYIKGSKVFIANIGDCMAVLSKTNGDYELLTKLHVPYKRDEYERIRISGGYVNNDKLDGGVYVSRAVGFFDLLPHIHPSPDISITNITSADDMLVVATHKLWDYMDYETACDIAREHSGTPMNAAEEMKDHAIAYGCSENITILCLSLQKSGEQQGNFALNRNSLMTRRTTFEDTTLRRLQPEITPPTGNLAMVFTDIKNSTFLWELSPDAMRTAIKTHNDIMRRQLRIYGGYEVKTEGDSFMVAFPTPISALAWCLSVQLKLLDAQWPEEITSIQDGSLISDKNGIKIYHGLSVRMGIHWGCPVPELDLVTQRMDYLGPVVNKAARVSGIADGGETTLSNDFCSEFNKILSFHNKVISQEETLKEAYGEEIVGEILEKEIALLETIGWEFFEYGEQKLKGLETKEYITIAYPKSVASRHEYIVSEEEETGIVSSDILFKLRTASNRLDSILSAINGGFMDKDNKEKQRNFVKLDTKAQEAIMSSISDVDVMSFLDHLVTRIESSVSLLQLRQRLNSSLDIVQSSEFPEKNIFQLLDELIEKANRAPPL